MSAAELAAREGVTPSHLTRIVRVACATPAVTDAILKGPQRRGVTVETLTLGGALTVRWGEQQAMLLAELASEFVLRVEWHKEIQFWSLPAAL